VKNVKESKEGWGKERGKEEDHLSMGCQTNYYRYTLQERRARWALAGGRTESKEESDQKGFKRFETKVGGGEENLVGDGLGNRFHSLKNEKRR